MLFLDIKRNSLQRPGTATLGSPCLHRRKILGCKWAVWEPYVHVPEPMQDPEIGFAGWVVDLLPLQVQHGFRGLMRGFWRYSFGLN